MLEAASLGPRRSRATFGRCAHGLTLALCLLGKVAAAEPFEIHNPVVPQRADPSIYRHDDGYYYFTATVPAYNLIELRRASALDGISAANPTVIWRAHTTGEMASHIWAPELHRIDESWYVYFAAGSSSNVWDIRVYVLSNTAQNPLEGTWTERGQILTNGPKSNGTYFALDATTFEHNGSRYLVWAEADPSIAANTVLFIAPMSNPWTLSARGVRISAPEYDWEKRGHAVNEGPAVLKRNGKIFISYSASATDANYCLGLLTASDTSDLLQASAWSKSSVPIFRSANGVYGPGHNQFTTSRDGSVDLLVYHARDYEKIVGEPLDDPNRATRVQPLTWKSDGTPDFGTPRADGVITIEPPVTNGGAAGSASTRGTTLPTGNGGRSGTITANSSVQGGSRHTDASSSLVAAVGGSGPRSSTAPASSSSRAIPMTSTQGGSSSSHSVNPSGGGQSQRSNTLSGGVGATRLSDSSTKSVLGGASTTFESVGTSDKGCTCRWVTPSRNDSGNGTLSALFIVAVARLLASRSGRRNRDRSGSAFKVGARWTSGPTEVR